MYRIDFTDMNNAAEILYCFMTIPTLHKPECSVWGSSGLPVTIENYGTGFMSEKDFCEKIRKSDADAITCVASMDYTDTRRVTLSLMPDTDYLVLNFPSPNGEPNEAEKRLLKILEL